MYDLFFTQIKKNSLVITVNQRLCDWLKNKYSDQAHLIYYIQTWLEQCWANTKDTHSLLSPAEEHVIWLESIASDGMLFSDACFLARKIQTIYEVTKQWNKNLLSLSPAYYEDFSQLQQWIRVFEKKCAQQKVISRSCLASSLLDKISTLSWPHKLYLLGFDTLTPQIHQLLEALPCPYEIEKIVPVNSNKPRPQAREYLNIHEELRAMLNWAAEQQQQNTQAFILCAVPELEKHRDTIVQLCYEIFYPNKLLPSTEDPLPVNISIGRRLHEVPLIDQAFSLLSLDLQKNAQTILSDLLTSPFLGEFEQEMAARGDLDSLLREQELSTLSWALVKKIILKKQINTPEYCTAFLNYITAWQALMPLCQGKKSLLEWAEIFVKILAAWRWPGQPSLTEEESAQLTCWQNFLSEFSELNVAVFDRSNALALLKHLACHTWFQSKIHSENQIQILGLLETTGLEADAIWVAGLNDTQWPARVDYLPYLPTQWQRDWQLPHSSSERELYFSKTLMRRFCQLAKQTIFSYAIQAEDREVAPSPLLASFSLQKLQIEKTASQNTLFLKIESPREEPEIKIPPKETVIKGGASVYKSQATCPFQAFARYRLKARALPLPHLGLNAKERGTLLHHTLELIWKKLKNQEHLLNSTDQQLVQLIHHSASSALNQFLSDRQERLPAPYRPFEIKRLTQLSEQWLALEKMRPPFKILLCEDWEISEQAGLKIKIKFDRIDALPNDQQLLIDYKTGVNFNIHCLQQDQGFEPQLPLYCLQSPDINAVAFAQIHGSQLKFIGLSEKETGIPGIEALNEGWSELRHYWAEKINTLARQFQQGFAAVAPQEGACNYCDLHTLCRVQ